MQELDFSKINVLVVGDYILDQYLGGDVERISPEAPVPVLKMSWSKNRLGGAGNVINNLCTMGSNARALACIGSGRTGDTLYNLLVESGADLRYVYRNPSVSTIKKIRVVARNQQVIRIDDEQTEHIPEGFFEFIHSNIDGILSGINAVILSDYGKGVLTKELTQYLITSSKSKGIPVFVDPKGNNWDKYRGVTACTPNLAELSQVYGNKIFQSDESVIYEVGLDICKNFDFDFLLVTRSEKGMSTILKTGEMRNYPVVKKEVVDVSGAGDTVICTFALCYALGIDLDRCCKVANLAASIVVSKFGTATLTINELNGAIVTNTKQKIVSFDEIGIISKELHDEGKQIVFTNGCFDIIHSGHIATFEVARSLGDVLIVGVNSDDSIRRLKGPTRPIVDEKNRLEVLRAISMIDYLVVFSEDTPLELIKNILPHVLVKGEDYADKEVVGRDVVEANGGKVQLIPFVEGMSTSKIIEKILTVYKNQGIK